MRKSPAKARSEDSPAYISTPAHAALPSHSDALLALEGMPTAWVVSYALDRVQADLPTAGPMMGGPAAVREYLVLKNASHADQMVERFSVLFLDSQHRVLTLVSIHIRHCWRMNYARHRPHSWPSTFQSTFAIAGE